MLRGHAGSRRSKSKLALPPEVCLLLWRVGTSTKRLLLTLLAYSALMDFCLALFPSLLIGKLQVKKAEKYAIIFVMSLGVL